MKDEGMKIISGVMNFIDRGFAYPLDNDGYPHTLLGWT
jgi:hypothetical protein